MTDGDTIPKYGMTRVQLYGCLFRRGVRHAAMGVGYYYRGESGRVELGDDMLAAYEATMHLHEQSGGRD
jgi:hypothetical protein